MTRFPFPLVAGHAITFGWRERLDVLAAVRTLEARVLGFLEGAFGVRHAARDAPPSTPRGAARPSN